MYTTRSPTIKRWQLTYMPKQPRTTRLCRTCQQMLPLDKFNPKITYAYCIDHVNAYIKLTKKRGVKKTPCDIIRFRCWVDKKAFGQIEVKLTKKSICQLLCDDQLSDTKAWAIVPICPTSALTQDNATVVSSVHRRYLMAQWKLDNNVEVYQHILQYKK